MTPVGQQAPAMEMPRYRCHKEVHALKIGAIEGLWIYPEEDGYAPFQLDAEYFERHKPTVGGYYVVYKDGYRSFSPAAAFEEGYTLISAPLYGSEGGQPPEGQVEGKLPA